MASTLESTMLADGDLARRVSIRGADSAAAEAELCARFRRRVRLYGLRHLGSVAAADDLAQRVMLLMLEKLRAGAVREPDRVGSFVLGVARMLAREERRAALREVPADETDRPHSPAELDPFAARQLARCMEGLGQRERTVVVLTYYSESTSGEIGATLGVAEGHVRVIRHRAIARLRDCLGLETDAAAAENRRPATEGPP